MLTKEFESIINYYDQNVSKQSADNLLFRTDEKLNDLLKYPELGRLSKSISGVRFVLISKHYRLYYLVEGKGIGIEVVSFFDTRQNPKKDKFG